VRMAIIPSEMIVTVAISRVLCTNFDPVYSSVSESKLMIIDRFEPVTFP